MNIPSTQIQIKSVAGVLRFQPQIGRPTAITVTIRKSDNSNLPTPVVGVSVLGNLSAVSTTVKTAVAAGSTTVELTSVSGLSLEDDLLIGVGDQAEWVKVKSIALLVLTLFRPLERAHAATEVACKTDTFYSMAAANNEDVDTLRRCHWVYTVAGISYEDDTLYNVVLHSFRNPCVTATLYALQPDLQTYRPREQSDFDAQIAQGVQLVGNRLRLRGLALGNLMADSVAELPIAYATLMILGESWLVADPNIQPWLERMTTALEREVEILVASPVWYERAVQDQVLDTDEAESLPHYMGVA